MDAIAPCVRVLFVCYDRCALAASSICGAWSSSTKEAPNQNLAICGFYRYLL